MKNFRTWLQEMWFEHQSELEGYGQTLSYDLKEYFNKYKYWLKREYKHQRSIEENTRSDYERGTNWESGV